MGQTRFDPTRKYSMTKKVWFKNSKGQKLAGIIHLPKKFKGRKPAGIVVSHGINSHKNSPFMRSIAFSLEKAGFVVLRLDLNGNGDSEGDKRKRTYTGYKKDIKAAVEFLVKKGIKRLGVIGHSMSGPIIVQEKINEKHIQCIGLIAPVVDPIWTHYGRLTKKEQNEIDELGYYISRAGNYSYSAFLKDLKNQKVLQAAKKIVCPVIIYAADKDHCITYKQHQDLFKNVLCEVKYLKKMRSDHSFTKKRYKDSLNKDLTYWFSKYLHYRSPVINAFVQHQGKILILKRSLEVSTHRGVWDCVGGYLKTDLGKDGELKVKENPKQRALHEIGEELGIPARDLKLVKKLEPFEADDKEEDKVWLSHMFLFEAKNKKVKLDWEHTDYKWIDPKDLKKYKHLPDLAKNLKKLLK